MWKKSLISTGIMTLILINIFLWPYLLNNQDHNSIDEQPENLETTSVPKQMESIEIEIETELINEEMGENDSSNIVDEITEPSESISNIEGPTPFETDPPFQIINIK
ncbi:hypothetical protein [Bacillus solimangrovi]|uniref:Uncharacterized protein n=1 Tax=Bacillus solimangrovi TaxID=1305675 RepID=A0A1E5LDK0_9BACI|nr:hypothetical protein [Bacillus solimangrovi]OEH92163.1 hypothetical protein BFG57_02520 [Bacillus solimangrovi]